MIYDPVYGTLAGRKVEIRHVGLGYARAARKVYEDTGDAELLAYAILAHSAHWADTGERIFADAAAIDAWPMCDGQDVLALANQATELNRPRERKEPPPSSQPQPNGAGAEAHHPT